jgi:hypothetical protein
MGASLTPSPLDVDQRLHTPEVTTNKSPVDQGSSHMTCAQSESAASPLQVANTVTQEVVSREPNRADHLAGDVTKMEIGFDDEGSTSSGTVFSLSQVGGTLVN